jgi:hypothetical protein
MESLAAERFPKVRITSTCQHETTTCSSCLNQSIDSQIDHRDWDQVTCTECNEKLSYDDVKEAASDNGFQRYMKIQLNKPTQYLLMKIEDTHTSHSFLQSTIYLVLPTVLVPIVVLVRSALAVMMNPS